MDLLPMHFCVTRGAETILCLIIIVQPFSLTLCWLDLFITYGNFCFFCVLRLLSISPRAVLDIQSVAFLFGW